jgi:hypothetical protein
MRRWEIWVRPRMWKALILFYYLKILKFKLKRSKKMSDDQIDSVYTDLE